MATDNDGRPQTWPPLWALWQQTLAGATFTDLTHAFAPGIPHFAGFPDELRAAVLDFDADGKGFRADTYAHIGQWGTHVDPPLHFVAGGRPLDRIPVNEMLLPLVVLDISARVAADPDAVPTLDDLAAWEKRNGRVPKGAFVALRTDWSKRWPDPNAFFNRTSDGVPHYPGWSKPVLAALFEDRGVTAVGHEQVDTDPASATHQSDYSLEDYVLRLDRWQVEMLTNLDLVPDAGALVMATWPKPKGGSGFPARVVAIHLP